MNVRTEELKKLKNWYFIDIQIGCDPRTKTNALVFFNYMQHQTLLSEFTIILSKLNTEMY